MRLIDADALLEVLKTEHDYIMQDPEVGKPMKWREAVCFHRALKAIENAPTIDAVPVRWIPVTEEMPPPYVDVLVFGEYNRIAICYWCEDGNCFAHARDKCDVYFNVTHWMPLTCLMPKEGE